MNHPFFNRIQYLFRLITKGKIHLVWKAFSTRIYNNWLSFGYKRDLNDPTEKPRTLLKLDIRVANDDDEKYFIENYKDGLINQFETCYVGITKNDDPCCRLWIIDDTQNDKLQSAWKDIFPTIKPNEVLFENLFTIPKYRGFGVMPYFMDELCNIAKENGADTAITFGAVNDLSTLRSYSYAGFKPYVVRRKKWFLFKRTVTFEPIPEDLMAYYEKNAMTGKRLPKKKKD